MPFDGQNQDLGLNSEIQRIALEKMQQAAQAGNQRAQMLQGQPNLNLDDQVLQQAPPELLQLMGGQPPDAGGIPADGGIPPGLMEQIDADRKRRTLEQLEDPGFRG